MLEGEAVGLPFVASGEERDMLPELVRDDVFRLESRRLWLRWPTLADANAITRFVSVKEVAEMTGRIPHPYPPGEAEKRIFQARKDNATGTGWRLALALKGRPQDLIGLIGVNDLGDAAELGYWLGQPYHGQGLMTEAVQTVVTALFTLADFTSVAAGARVINPASARVLTKNGFAPEGSAMSPAPARGGPVPVDLFRLTRHAWEDSLDMRLPSGLLMPPVPRQMAEEACVPQFA
jgi:RimJ/RimL family protein N-acetyltransferase